MYKRLGVLLLGALALVITSVSAQTVDVSVRVVRVDPGAQIIVLDNNQAFRVMPNTVLMIGHQPVALGAVQPGQTVVIRSGEAVALAPAAATPGNTVVVNPPAASVATVVPAPQQTVYGRVDDVDKDAIKVKTESDSFEVRVPRSVAAQVRKGDTVRLDLTFQR